MPKSRNGKVVFYGTRWYLLSGARSTLPESVLFPRPVRRRTLSEGKNHLLDGASDGLSSIDERPVPLNAKYAHTNLIAEDWHALARFYQEVFGCTVLPPERHFQGTDLERGTGVSGSRLDGVHLRLPGYPDGGPTLEIFTYSQLKERLPADANRPGFGHIAFAVEDVREARGRVIDAGGGAVGDVVTLRVSPASQITWCYVRDPEGNIVELQSYAK